MKIGTDDWWHKEFRNGSHGIIHAILILVEANRISIKKGLELIDAATGVDRDLKGCPAAPWDEVRWPCIERQKSIQVNEDDGSCPKCSLEAKDYKKTFHSDGGDEEYIFTCRSCGERFTILRRVIVAEYSVKEKS